MSEKNHKIIAVTGANGFVGKHLVRELYEHEVTVIGIGQEPSAHEEIASLLDHYYSVDLTKEWPVRSKLDAVIHLAGLAAVGPSFDDPQKYINLNSAMITNMAEYYLHAGGYTPRLVVVGSGAVYSPNQPMALTEDAHLSITSPYVVSKVLVENQCEYYRNRGIDCVVARPFNHIGPGQGLGFLVPDVLAQLQTTDEISVGNIETKRDYTDVRDIARAYRLLATTPELAHNTYNACSGRSVSGREVIESLAKALSKENIEIIINASKIRPTDPDDIYGDATRLQQDTGWVPEISLEQTLKDCVTELSS